MSVFPFDAVVGQDEAKLALRLAAVDPRIGGVLLRGQKGSAKTTLARGLAALLGGAPFVELPLGATEDRVVGTIDVAAALQEGASRFRPGLLAAADGGVLYVDEVNLLPDHLVDVLLDVAVSGVNVVERDGFSHRHPARFVLLGSMNPEEGELRPQLLDRFGLCVQITAPSDVAARSESVRRRLVFDAGGPLPVPGPAQSLQDVVAGAIPDAVVDTACRLALEVGAEGLRADLTLCRAAAALAGLEGRPAAGADDLRRVAPLVLAHRRRRGPFDPPTLPPEELESALARALAADPGPGADPPEPGGGERPGDGAGDQGPGGSAPSASRDRPVVVGPSRRPAVPPPARRIGVPRGRIVREEAPGPRSGPVAAVPTARAVMTRRHNLPNAPLGAEDLRSAVRSGPVPRTVILCVDLSGSMGAADRAAAATGTVIGLLSDAYQRRDRVALVGFRGQGAEVLVPPTASVEVARNRLASLATGGETPLAAGLARGLEVAESCRDSDRLLVVLTDGRATGAPGALDRALETAATIRRRKLACLVLDCETGPSRLGLGVALAEALGARRAAVPDLDPEVLAEAIRAGAT
jgi:magnesium chelatase subunit D